MNDLAEIFKLSPAERIQLAEDLWDSVAVHPENVPLTETQRTEIERRIAEYTRAPLTAGWDEVRTRLWSRIG